MLFIQPQYSIPIYYCFDTVFSCFSLLISTILYSIFCRSFRIFYSFLSLYSVSTLFTETNLLWLIYESIKALETRTSIAFNLAFHSNTVLSCFFLFYLIIDSHFLILAVITLICNPTAELVCENITGNKLYDKLPI